MTAFLLARQIRIFDHPRFAEPLRDRVRDRAAELAHAAGVTIEHLAKRYIRKEDIVAKVLARRGDHPGLVHISVLASISPASAAPTSCHYLPNAFPPPSPDNSPACANSASLNAPPAPITRAAITAGRRLTQHTIIPALA
jgi:hypothetical protein